MIMACRNLDSGHAVRQDILADTSNYGPVPDAGSRLKVMHLDYEDLPTIRCAAAERRSGVLRSTCLQANPHGLVNQLGLSPNTPATRDWRCTSEAMCVWRTAGGLPMSSAG